MSIPPKNIDNYSTSVSPLLNILPAMKSVDFYFFVLVSIISMVSANPASSSEFATPALGLSPDPGFPAWLTPDIDNYLPLVASQTSGLDWLASSDDPSGYRRHWFIMCDDSFEAGIHLVSVLDIPGNPEIHFHRSDLTLPPPEITYIPLEPGHSYDWEAIAVHPWTDTVLLSQEGSLEEISLYSGLLSPGDLQVDGTFRGRAGEVDFLPGYISNIKPCNPPGWDDAFGTLFVENQGNEGVAMSEDRLFIALESPYDFATRIGNMKSTVLGVWAIDPSDPFDMEDCAPLKIIDTSDWEPVLGCKIETICGLDAINSSHLVGIDRDNQLLFAVEFDENYDLISGRIFFLYCPGPEPLESDDCPDLARLPVLMKPSLESVAVVPIYAPGSDMVIEYQVYLTCDPWAPGWTLNEEDWGCENYEHKLYSLLPAIYRYTIPADVIFSD